MIKLFLKFELEKIIKYFKTKTLAKVITSILFLGVFLFVGLGIYSFFISGFRFINIEAVEDIKIALTLFIYEAFLLILGGVIIFSAMVSGLFNLFRGEYNNWFISSPGYKFFPRMILFRSSVSSALLSFVIFIPAIVAFNKVYSLGALSLFFILLSVILFLVVLNALTLLSILGIGFLYYKVSQKTKAIPFSFRGLIALLILLTTALVAFLWRIFINIDLGHIFRGREAMETLQVENISSYFHLLPSHPFAMEIVNWQNHQVGDALYNVAILAVLAFLLSYVWWRVSFVFYPLWQKFQEGNSQKEVKEGVSFGSSIAYHFNGSKTMALFKKEALISSRNLKGLLWFMFLLCIWLVQIGANLILDNNLYRYQSDISQKIIALQAFQFIIAIYFISSFTLRFVFPSFSVEKKTAWIVASAPLSFKKIFFGKYLFYTSFFVCIGIVMNYINSLVLHVSVVNTLYSTVLLVSTIIFIVTLGLSFGAVFASSETDDPEVISTSMSGLFFTALALIYGAISAGVLYLTLTKGTVTILSLFVVITFVLIAIMLLKTPRLVKSAVGY